MVPLYIWVYKKAKPVTQCHATITFQGLGEVNNGTGNFLCLKIHTSPNERKIQKKNDQRSAKQVGHSQRWLSVHAKDQNVVKPLAHILTIFREIMADAHRGVFFSTDKLAA